MFGKYVNLGLLFCLAGVGTPLLHAADGANSSGGGNALVCFDKHPWIAQKIRNQKLEISDEFVKYVTKVEALDLTEARQERGLSNQKKPQIIDIAPGETAETYAVRIITRLENALPEEAARIRKSASAFTPDDVIREKHGLKKVEDTKEVQLFDSKHCVLATIAVQTTDAYATLLHLDWRLFNHKNHSPLSRGVLLLHEYFYRNDLDRGATDSRETRAKVALIITKNIPMTTLVKYFSAYEDTYPLYLAKHAFVDMLRSVGEAYTSYTTDNKDRITSLMAGTNNFFKRTSLREGILEAGYIQYGENVTCYYVEECFTVLDALVTGKLVKDTLISSDRRKSIVLAHDLSPGLFKEALQLYDLWKQIRDERAHAMVSAAETKYENDWQPKVNSILGMPVADIAAIDKFFYETILLRLRADTYKYYHEGETEDSGWDYWENWLGYQLRIESSSPPSISFSAELIASYFRTFKPNMNYILP